MRRKVEEEGPRGYPRQVLKAKGAGRAARCRQHGCSLERVRVVATQRRETLHEHRAVDATVSDDDVHVVARNGRPGHPRPRRFGKEIGWVRSQLALSFSLEKRQRETRDGSLKILPAAGSSVHPSRLWGSSLGNREEMLFVSPDGVGDSNSLVYLRNCCALGKIKIEYIQNLFTVSSQFMYEMRLKKVKNGHMAWNNKLLKREVCLVVGIRMFFG